MENRYGISRDRCRGNDPPSFSSTLLDSIYRSFDNSGHERSRSRLQQSGDGCLHRGNSNSEAAMMMRSSSCYPERPVRRNRGVGEVDGGRSRDRVVDRWMEKKTTRHDEFVGRRRYAPSNMSVEFSSMNSAAADDGRRSLGSVKMKSSSMSSSDSSSGFGFSSSDTDSFAGAKKKKSLEPIRTTASDCSETFRPLTAKTENFTEKIIYRKNRHSDQRPETFDGSGGRRSAKSRAMKFYGDLKRIKQPISPGGKLATFLNSLFTVGSNSKKQRISTSIPATAIGGDYDNNARCDRPESKSNIKTMSTPTCSTASSYTRSCLGKSPMSAGRYGGAKRSVRFCPVSVILAEELQPPGHKCLHSDEDLTVATSRTDPKVAIEGESKLTIRVAENNRKSVEEAAMDLMRNYHKKWEVEGAKEEVEMIDNQDDEGEDVESCCSADLFELENLMEIGVDRYCAELPVYETTHVNTNRAIATGLIL